MILVGDALERLRGLPEHSVQTCITSPPFWQLRDYGEEDQLGLEERPEEYVEKLVAIFREVRRVLRDDGTVWLNLGDTYASKTRGSDKGWSKSRLTNPGTVQKAQSASLRNANGDRHRGKSAGLKEKDLVGIPWLVAFALRADGWFLRKDIIWCLSGGTRLYAKTQKGEGPVTLKDLVRLDPATVQLWNGGKWTQVLGWSRSPEPRDGALEIELRSGERIGCTAGHLWPTQRGNVRADEIAVGDIVGTTTLPEPDPPLAPAYLPDAEIGWLCGRYLADGSASGDTVQLACHRNEADELLRRVAPIARDLHCAAAVHMTGGSSATVNLHGPLVLPVIRAYIYGKNAKTKGLTARCWNRSNQFLRSLLHGYLSGDGHEDVGNRRWRLGFTRNDRLAADLRTLAGRLGATLTLRATHGEGVGERWPTYRGEIRLQRSGHHNERARSEVLAVRRSRARQFWDIGVADAPHLFALGSGVLSHNSKPNAMPESIGDRPSSSHEYLFLLSKKARYFYDADAIRHPYAPGSKKRIEAGFKDRYDGMAEAIPNAGHRGVYGGPNGEQVNPDGRNKRSVWEVPEELLSQFLQWLALQEEAVPDVWDITTQPFPEAHFAVFPPKLVEPCIRAGSPPQTCAECGAPWVRQVERERLREGEPIDGTWSRPDEPRRIGPTGVGHYKEETRVRTVGWKPSCDHAEGGGKATVLDPFAGAGTTGLVAAQLDREFLGIELSQFFAEMAEDRIASYLANPNGHLPGDPEPIEGQMGLLG